MIDTAKHLDKSIAGIDDSWYGVKIKKFEI